jgi:hypothetical protein
MYPELRKKKSKTKPQSSILREKIQNKIKTKSIPKKA